MENDLLLNSKLVEKYSNNFTSPITVEDKINLLRKNLSNENHNNTEDKKGALSFISNLFSRGKKNDKNLITSEVIECVNNYELGYKTQIVLLLSVLYLNEGVSSVEAIKRKLQSDLKLSNEDIDTGLRTLNKLGITCLSKK